MTKGAHVGIVKLCLEDNLSLFVFQEVTGSLFLFNFSGKIHFAFLNYTNCQAFLYALRLALICNK